MTTSLAQRFGFGFGRRHAAGGDAVPPWLWALAGIALLAGAYGRFKGLGAAPLGADEFYMLRSIENLLRAGLPEFLCGGYYNRGLAYQYLAGALQTIGLSPELAGRGIAAACSLAVLPAVYLLGRRLHSRTVGVLAMALVAMSIWEIEMARFARMYAPFQTVFAWYLVFLLRYIVDGERKALRGMIALSLLGVLTWEGGALIGLLNLLPPLLRHRDGRLQPVDWGYIGGMLVLFAVLYAVATADLRTLTDSPAYAPGIDPYAASARPVMHDATAAAMIAQPAWLVLGAACLAFALLPLRWIWSLRQRWLSAAGLGTGLLAALGHQFLIVAAIVVVLLLSGLLERRELVSRDARAYWIAILVCAAFWIAFGLSSDAWLNGQASLTPASMEIMLCKLFGFPNVIDNVVRPWGRTTPLLAAMLGVALTALAALEIARPAKPPSATAVVLVVTIAMVLAVGTLNGDRFETRYLFFLYPIMLLLAVIAVARAVERIAPGRVVAGNALDAVLVACVLAGFALSEDFQPRQIAHIDSPAVTLRVGMRQALTDHYYPHNDVRSAGRWLEQTLRPGDLMISGIPSLDWYNDGADFFFLDERDNRYESFACAAGATERWTDTPLLYGMDMLQSQVASGRRLLLVMYPSFASRVVERANALGWHYRTAWRSMDRGVQILEFNPR